MLPASISVAPNSPSARAKTATMPAASPRRASGRETRKKTARGPVAQRGRGQLVTRIDLLEGDACRANHQRKGHHAAAITQATQVNGNGPAGHRVQRARRANPAGPAARSGSSRSPSAAAPAAASAVRRPTHAREKGRRARIQPASVPSHGHDDRRERQLSEQRSGERGRDHRRRARTRAAQHRCPAAIGDQVVEQRRGGSIGVARPRAPRPGNGSAGACRPGIAGPGSTRSGNSAASVR